MSSIDSPSSLAVKSFLAGAVVTLSTAWIVHRAKNQNSSSPGLSSTTTRCTPSDVRATTSSASSAQTSIDNNTARDETQVLFDSPYLEERMIRKAEATIRGRTSRLVIVVERCTNNHNYSAILRTAEALGIQHLYIVAPPPSSSSSQRDEADDDENGNDTNSNHTSSTATQSSTDNSTLTTSTGKVIRNASVHEVQDRAMHHLFAQRATDWLTVHEFDDTASCFARLKQEGYHAWATDLGQSAVCLIRRDLEQQHIRIPHRLAIVFGTEAVGCTQECLESADLRVYLPLRGFADSLNLSVATALVIQQLFVLDPTLVGSMDEDERVELRKQWFSKLAKQRLLTSSQKKRKSRLEIKLRNCERLQQCVDQGSTLQVQQHNKLNEMNAVQRELEAMNADLEKRARLAVADLVANPPEPITDMRRPDEHRTCYVGRKTKKRNEEAWENMPATSNDFHTEKGVSSSEYFRNRAVNGETPTT